ncbi:MAG: type I-E CRISPR-associated endoribonuclease Cas2, partial [Candidatus Promineofilum sp.]|nr:type I-E CRISPR-associated endoribonuclease Cas2 [Promineifilum sp.]
MRGELSRWLMEPKPGCSSGTFRAWCGEVVEKCCRGARGGGVIQAWSTNNEQR